MQEAAYAVHVKKFIGPINDTQEIGGAYRHVRANGEAGDPACEKVTYRGVP